METTETTKNIQSTEWSIGNKGKTDDDDDDGLNAGNTVNGTLLYVGIALLAVICFVFIFGCFYKTKMGKMKQKLNELQSVPLSPISPRTTDTKTTKTNMDGEGVGNTEMTHVMSYDDGPSLPEDENVDGLFDHDGVDGIHGKETDIGNAMGLLSGETPMNMVQNADDDSFSDDETALTTPGNVGNANNMDHAVLITPNDEESDDHDAMYEVPKDHERQTRGKKQ